MVAANSLTIEGGAEIASSTAGPGAGGDVDVAVAGDIMLPDRGPQITARSTGSGDAGSITVSAYKLTMNNGAAISTEAETSTANGGNITLSVGDFLYLTSSEITTSVKGETGNGGNITIDPHFVVLNHSDIIAQAVEGHGGNITINAGVYIASADSIVSATSQLGISGTVHDQRSAGRSERHPGGAVERIAQCGGADPRQLAAPAAAGRNRAWSRRAGAVCRRTRTPRCPALYIAGRDLKPGPRAADPRRYRGRARAAHHRPSDDALR